jgi:hypothetical protein
VSRAAREEGSCLAWPHLYLTCGWEKVSGPEKGIESRRGQATAMLRVARRVVEKNLVGMVPMKQPRTPFVDWRHVSMCIHQHLEVLLKFRSNSLKEKLQLSCIGYMHMNMCHEFMEGRLLDGDRPHLSRVLLD